MKPQRKRNQPRILLFILLLWTISSTATAATKSATVTVSVNVLPACTAGTTVSGTTTFGTLNFGTLYYLNKTVRLIGQPNAGAILVQCASGVDYQVVFSAGNSGNVAQRYMTGNTSGQHVNYNLYSDANYSTVWNNTTGVTRSGTGQQEWIPVYGQIPVQSTPVVDIYTDTVQVTVNW
ncbi:Csu type fimbrial protein [Budvicia diplopodorum]|uniref:Csu type fimbrial protein n=1 Tax=Budvicia diplopodorum TaxID=1119056 RepID=UPI001358455B|nr:spore coat U domain-containing protein [Budvicia diplopodorum]